MSVVHRLALLGAAIGLAACSNSTTVAATQSLLASEDAAFICAHYDDDGNLVGDALDSCPDFSGESNAPALYSLVTQPETGEVALLDMAACAAGTTCSAVVKDLEPTQPGINFLAVGGEPGSIVSTPGGMASFVGVREAGREGIFGLPTSCVGPRPESKSIRDLRTWPACRLPSAPGAMELVVDPRRTDACDGSHQAPASDLECYADLDLEQSQPGRRLLVVALPARGEIWTIDAQKVLNLEAGSFDDCPVENVLALSTQRPALIEQQVPAELSGADSCGQVGTLHPSAQQNFRAVPADFARFEERLYVADTGAPVIHEVDLSDTCAPVEKAPLLPVAYTQPGLVVPTRKLAVSPLSASGEQFVYAVDGSQSTLAGSVMIFDVSPGSTNRTPILRPRSALIVNEPPDRIQLGEEAVDVSFAYQELPAGEDGVFVEGIRCSADPEDTSVAADYRPGNAQTGAEPKNLRGLFGFVALQSGYVAVVDIDDLDAECRRSATVNRGAEPDQRGCANDPWSGALKLRNNTFTVSDENTCHIVQPHRVRSQSFFSHHDNGTAPILRTLPQLRSGLGASLAQDATEEGAKHPKILGVPYPGIAEHSVYFGSTELRTDAVGGDQLILAPELADRGSVLLPETEPRAYNGGGENFAVVFEGALPAAFRAPVRLVRAADEPRLSTLGVASTKRFASLSLAQDNQFCFAGVEDALVTEQRAEAFAANQRALGLPEIDPETFVREHTDYASIVADFPEDSDPYWQDAGATCGESYPWRGSGTRPTGRAACESIFGKPDLETRDQHRDLRILRAFNDELLVEPRLAASDREGVLDALACCFPFATSFEVRAMNEWVFTEGGVVPHAIRPNPDTLACELRDCDPLLAAQHGRVFEVACTDETCPGVGPVEAALGASAQPCVLKSGHSGPLSASELAAGCFLDGLTARFAVFQGAEPSRRGMVFSWVTGGGFSPLLLNLNQNRGTVSPRRIVFQSQVNRLVVPDGGSVGLTLLGLRQRDGSPGFSFGTIY